MNEGSMMTSSWGHPLAVCRDRSLQVDRAHHETLSCGTIPHEHPSREELQLAPERIEPFPKGIGAMNSDLPYAAAMMKRHRTRTHRIIPAAQRRYSHRVKSSSSNNPRFSAVALMAPRILTAERKLLKKNKIAS